MTLHSARVLPPTRNPPIQHCRNVLHGLRHHVPPILLPRYKNRVFQTTWFEPQTVDVLTTCPHSHAKRTQCTKPHDHAKPINCHLIPHKDTMTPYMALTCHYLNSQVPAIFFLSATSPAMIHYSGFWQLTYILHIMVCDRFLHLFYIFYNLTHIRFKYIS